MVKEVVRPPTVANHETPEPTHAQPSPAGRATEVFTRRRLVILLGVSLALQGIVLGYAWLRGGTPEGEQPPEAEIALGEFRYHGDRAEGGRVARAEFSLYVALADHARATNRTLLIDHRYRIRQGVEEILRRAHAGDFEDPSLKDLKRRVRDRIEETVGERVLADVMLTDLNIHWNLPETTGAAEAKATDVKSRSETAEATPWAETSKPSG